MLAIFSADRHKHCCEQKNNEGVVEENRRWTKMVDKDVIKNKKTDNKLDDGSGVLVSADPQKHWCAQ